MPAFLFVCLIGAAWGGTIYVKPAATGSNNGTSWANAYKDLVPALAAAKSGDEIWVASATYKPTAGADRGVSFMLPAGVAVYGGFAGTETSRGQRNWTARPTTLSGEIGAAGTADNSYHVVVGANKARLDGFIVRDGLADSTANAFKSGAGLYCDRVTTMTVANCTFRNNAATSCGAAVFSTGDSQSIVSCSFTGNSINNYSGHAGGAIYNSGKFLKVSSCAFEGNSVYSFSPASHPAGGALYNSGASAAIVNCTFKANYVLSGAAYESPNGGAICNAGPSLVVTQCNFSANSAKQYGGAIYNTGNSAVVSGCTFTGNRAYGGAGLFNSGTTVTVSVCAFNANAATGDGGGGILNAGLSQTVTNCAFDANTAIGPSSNLGMGGGILNGTFTGNPQVVTWCRFTRNTFTNSGGGICSLYDTPIVTYCTFSDNYSTGTASTAGAAISKARQISNCVFRNNSADSAGAVNSGPMTESVADCVFVGNTAKGLNGYGGGLFMTSAYFNPVVVSNCVFIANSAKSGGAIEAYSAGIYGWTNSEIANCTFSQNSATNYGGAFHQQYPMEDISTSATNCVFWGNTAKQGGPDVFIDSGIMTVSHCDLSDWDGSHWNPNFGTNRGGNIKGNPKWVSAANPAGPDGLYMTWDDGLRLQTGSPCIDAGYTVVAPSKDILGIPREGAADIGAYEFITPRNAARGWMMYW
ncbi:hypothetical protein LLG95_05595 [bacterium]|nr:hypothetical protein [bacterium]